MYSGGLVHKLEIKLKLSKLYIFCVFPFSALYIDSNKQIRGEYETKRIHAL